MRRGYYVLTVSLVQKFQRRVEAGASHQKRHSYLPRRRAFLVTRGRPFLPRRILIERLVKRTDNFLIVGARFEHLSHELA